MRGGVGTIGNGIVVVIFKIRWGLYDMRRTGSKDSGELEIIVRLKDTSVEETLDSMEEKDDKTRSEKKKKKSGREGS